MIYPINYDSEYKYMQYCSDSFLNLMINEIGVDAVHKPLPPRSVPRYCIHFVIKGKGQYTIAGKTYSLQENDFCITYPNMLFSMAFDETIPREVFWMNFDGESVEELFANAHFSAEDPVYSIKKPKKIHMCIQRLVRYNNNNSNLRLRAFCAFLEIFAQISEERATELSFNTKSNSEYYVQKACKFIQKNYANPYLKIEDICKDLSLSHSYLCKIFNKLTGISIYRYLLTYRMQQAKLLLETTDEKIINVANAVGYLNSSYFCREFKRLFNQSPLNYRKELKNFRVETHITNKFNTANEKEDN